MSFNTKAKEIRINFPSELHRDLIDIKIPYLYSIGQKVDFFDNYSSIHDGFFVDSYVRTRNNAQSDGKFKAHSSKGFLTVACECKNRANVIRTPVLKTIIENSIKKHDAKLILVFCTKFGDSSTRTSEFSKLCEEQQVNVYRIVKKGHKLCSLEPLCKNFQIHPNPQRICIVFESASIVSLVNI